MSGLWRRTLGDNVSGGQFRQVVPVVEVEQVRGLYGWRVNALLDAATEAAERAPGEASVETVRSSLREFLTRVYFDLRNLGKTSRMLRTAVERLSRCGGCGSDRVSPGPGRRLGSVSRPIATR